MSLPMKDVDGQVIGEVTEWEGDKFTAVLLDGTTLTGRLDCLSILDLKHSECAERCTEDTHFLGGSRG